MHQLYFSLICKMVFWINHIIHEYWWEEDDNEENEAENGNKSEIWELCIAKPLIGFAKDESHWWHNCMWFPRMTSMLQM